MKRTFIKWGVAYPLLCLSLFIGCDFEDLPHARLTEYELSPTLVENVFDVQVLREIGNLEDFLKKLERLGMPIHQGNEPPELYTFDANSIVGVKFRLANACIYDEKNSANVNEVFGKYEQDLLIRRGQEGGFAASMRYISVGDIDYPLFPDGLDRGSGEGFVTGSGQDFTMYTRIENGNFDGIAYQALWIISGRVEDNDGIYSLTNVVWSFVMLGKGADPQDRVANKGTLRIFRDLSPEWMQSDVLLTQVSPTEGPYGTELTILGSGFSPVPANNRVWINESLAIVTDASPIQLKAIVPKGAGTGTIRIEVLEKSATGAIFNYIPIYTVYTLAGNGIGGITDGIGDQASFLGPSALALDMQGNLFVTDTGNGLIRFVSHGGEVKTISAPGQFYEPIGICSDGENGAWVSDRAYQMVTRIFSDHSILYMYEIFGPTGIARGIDQTLYLSLSGRYSEVLKLFHNGEYEEWRTISGKTQFFDPWALSVDAEGNVYVAEAGNSQVRMITPSDEVVELIPPNQVSGTRGISLDVDRHVIVSDTRNHQIKRISPSGEISILAGTGQRGFDNGPGVQASFNFPYGIAIDEEGVIYIADSANHAIRKMVLE
jgi:hypothetical protein